MIKEETRGEKKNLYESIVIGAGHAGVEAALAIARLGGRVLLLTLCLDSLSFMACNPSIGGTAKGHLVREIDALGGQMGLSADTNLLQLRMLNSAKGAAVRSLRGQADKISYHHYMKRIVENEKNITLLQGEVSELICRDDIKKDKKKGTGKSEKEVWEKSERKVIEGVKTTLGETFYAKTVIVACGVYLASKIIIGDYTKNIGPSGFQEATELTKSLREIGLDIRRFKTGTPARVRRQSIDFSKMKREDGEEKVYPFSFMTDGFIENKEPCYLTYTNSLTHEIIKANISRSPLYNGSIKSIGPRYCPSIEDKVMRFADKERHQIFIEPESGQTSEMYVQGMSSSMPKDVQLAMYRSIEGMEQVEIMRYAYAIEYDCIDSTQLDLTLMVKHIRGLFCAGQINGSSGYEEAAAQGLIAGINAHCLIEEKPQFLIGREEGYIGVLIDDLVTKGTNEPYRMMTARAEYRLQLRQENADERLTERAYNMGLASEERMERLREKRRKMAEIFEILEIKKPPKEYNPLFCKKGESEGVGGMSFREMLKRAEITSEDLRCEFDEFKGANKRCFEEVETIVKYEGYLVKQEQAVKEIKKLEQRELPKEIDYKNIHGLRLEARQKLDKIRPLNLGQASRISGVTPSDITVLLVFLQLNKAK